MKAPEPPLPQTCVLQPFLNGTQLITKVKNNMKNSLMSVADKILLRKRALIETVNKMKANFYFDTASSH